MDTVKKNKPLLNTHHTASDENAKSHIKDAVSQLLYESKKYAHELYEEGLDKASATEKELEKYSEELINKVRQNPLKAILIAGGVGFLLSALLRK